MEKAYFPMKVCNISQGYGSNTYSHKTIKALDIAGANTGIDSAYAPFTGTVKKVYNTDNQVWLASNDKVLCADGVMRYLVMLVAHDNSLGLKVGQVIKQGDEFYHEGTFSNSSKITGNHIHMELGEGPFSGTGWFKNSGGVWQINKPLAPEAMLWLKNDTIVKNTVASGKDYMMKWDKEEPKYPFPIGDIIYPTVDIVLKSNAGYGNETFWELPKNTKCIVYKYNNVHGLYMALKNDNGEYFASAWTNEFDKFTKESPKEEPVNDDDEEIDEPNEDTNEEVNEEISKNWLIKILKNIIEFITKLFKKQN